jgi:polyene glycosyltransferase
MNSSRAILFASTPSDGLINSMMVVAGEFARRGVPDLWFATDDTKQRDVEALAAKSEVRFASTGDDSTHYTATRWDDQTYVAVTQASRFKAHRAMLQQTHDPDSHYAKYQALDEVVEKVQPALMVVNNLCLHGLQVAMTRKIPYVISAPFLPSVLFEHNLPADYPTPTSGLPLDMTPAQQKENRKFRRQMRNVGMHPSLLRRNIKAGKRMVELRIEPRSRSVAHRLADAELVLTYSVPGLDYPFSMPDNLHPLGAMIPPLPEIADSTESTGDDVTRWLDGHKSVVYIAFGTIIRLSRNDVEAIVQVARQLAGKHRVLWKLPKEQQHMLPADLPDNLRIEQWLPSQYDVLAHRNVRAYFNHGGSNSFHEGIHFATPQLIRPLWLDCFDQSVRAVDSGVGLTVAGSDPIDADEVHDKLVRLLEENSFQDRAQHFSQLMQAAGGVKTAADLILDCAALKR